MNQSENISIKLSLLILVFSLNLLLSLDASADGKRAISVDDLS